MARGDDDARPFRVLSDIKLGLEEMRTACRSPTKVVKSLPSYMTLVEGWEDQLANAQGSRETARAIKNGLEEVYRVLDIIEDHCLHRKNLTIGDYGRGLLEFVGLLASNLDKVISYIDQVRGTSGTSALRRPTHHRMLSIPVNAAPEDQKRNIG